MFCLPCVCMNMAWWATHDKMWSLFPHLHAALQTKSVSCVHQCEVQALTVCVVSGTSAYAALCKQHLCNIEVHRDRQPKGYIHCSVNCSGQGFSFYDWHTAIRHRALQAMQPLWKCLHLRTQFHHWVQWWYVLINSQDNLRYSQAALCKILKASQDKATRHLPWAVPYEE